MSEDHRAGKSMSKEPKSKSRVKIHLPLASRAKRGGASQNVHTLDCAADDFHPPARAKGRWRFAKYKFAQSKDKTWEYKYTHLYIKKEQFVLQEKLHFAIISEENARVHFAQKRRKIQISSLSTKSKTP